MKKTRKSIYMIATNGNEILLETVKDEETAKLKIRHYEKMDRYEVEVEGYYNRLPKYIYR